jgi:hypothetical protein
MQVFTNSPLVRHTNISPNRNSPRNRAIDTITIHCVAGNLSIESLGALFAPTSRQASSNYGIGSDGRVGMYVEEKDRSWCTSSGANDHRAITIEVANTEARHPWPVSDKAMAALIELCACICRRNNITRLIWKADKSLIGNAAAQNMTVHRWFANKACPGDILFERHGNIAAEVNKLLGAAPAPAPVEPLTPPVAGEYRVRINTDTLNIRSGPGTNNAIVGAIRDRGIYTIVAEATGTGATKWGRLKSGAGWISLDHTIRLDGVTAPATPAPAPAATPNMPTTATEKTIWDFLKGKGLNDYAVAGIMGNLFAESGLRPRALERSKWAATGHNDDTYTEAVDNRTYTNFVRDSAGYGLAQWTFWSRKQELLNFQQAQKKSIGDLGLQLDFLWREIQTYTRTMNVLRTAATVRAASDIVLTDYERPAIQTEQVQLLRASYGQVYFDRYAGKEPEKTTYTPAPAPPAKTPEEITVDNAIADGLITDRLHWMGVLTGTIKPNPEFIKIVLDRAHQRINP